MKVCYKIIAAQAIALKKGYRGNKAGDGPVGVGSVEKETGGNSYIYICIHLFIFMLD
jgi:ABC-type transporter Mla maintaining outer membrane lipid asymmetry permease subunit MlaE